MRLVLSEFRKTPEKSRDTLKHVSPTDFAVRRASHRINGTFEVQLMQGEKSPGHRLIKLCRIGIDGDGDRMMREKFKYFLNPGIQQRLATNEGEMLSERLNLLKESEEPVEGE